MVCTSKKNQTKKTPKTNIYSSTTKTTGRVTHLGEHWKVQICVSQSNFQDGTGNSPHRISIKATTTIKREVKYWNLWNWGLFSLPVKLFMWLIVRPSNSLFGEGRQKDVFCAPEKLKCEILGNSYFVIHKQ